MDYTIVKSPGKEPSQHLLFDEASTPTMALGGSHLIPETVFSRKHEIVKKSLFPEFLFFDKIVAKCFTHFYPYFTKGPGKVRIHPSAVVSQNAKIGKGVKIGPFCVVECDVEIGDGCRLESRSTVKSGTIIGNNNMICEGTVIGGMPQHIAVHDVCGTLVIGDGNVIRENATIHRSMKEQGTTVIGDNNMIMVNVHIAHDCRLGNNIVIANNAMLAGHVCVEDRANISGAVGIHQYSRIGTLAMVGGQAHVTQDVPPFMTVDGLTSRIVGLNLIGLRRSGFSIEEIKQIKSAYRILYRSQIPWREVLKTLETTFTSGPALKVAQFLASTTRGILNERRTVLGQPTLKLHDAKIEETTKEEFFPNAIPIQRNVG